MFVRVALVRMSQVGEDGQKVRHLLVGSVAEGIVREDVEGGRERGCPGQRADLDLRYVVEDSPSIREACEVASKNSQRVRGLRGRNRYVQPQHIRSSFASEVREGEPQRQQRKPC